MFEEKRALFVYCVSPVHMGAGTAIGVIDNPIQRERHTDFPILAGSGLKGAIRHELNARSQSDGKELVLTIFGPEPERGGSESTYAGAVSFSDAHIVLFPVRSIKEAFVYVTSPTVIARTLRTLNLAGINPNPKWEIPAVEADHCLTSNKSLLAGNKRLPLESFDFKAEEDKRVKNIAEWVAQNALPADQNGYNYFRNKIGKDLVILSDEDFGYFVRNATLVEPHVRISDTSGTAEERGLFYTENLPPETLLLTILMASRERRGNGGKSARDVIETIVHGKGETRILPGLDGLMVQIGGDATTGRGQVVLKAVEGGKNA
jgi:CRISPR-associated protein Cmr4